MDLCPPRVCSHLMLAKKGRLGMVWGPRKWGRRRKPGNARVHMEVCRERPAAPEALGQTAAHRRVLPCTRTHTRTDVGAHTNARARIWDVCMCVHTEPLRCTHMRKHMYTCGVDTRRAYTSHVHTLTDRIYSCTHTPTCVARATLRFRNGTRGNFAFAPGLHQRGSRKPSPWESRLQLTR